jgi:hypothetical protein
VSKKGTSDKFPDRHKVVDAICERLAQGEGLTVICRDDDMPNFSQVYKWRKADAELGKKLDEARAVGFDVIAESCIEIADATDNYRSRDSIPLSKGRKDRDGRVLQIRDPQRDKLRVWTRMQLLAKWDPKRYGERMQHANDPDNPLPAPQFIINPVKPKDGDE